MDNLFELLAEHAETHAKELQAVQDTIESYFRGKRPDATDAEIHILSHTAGVCLSAARLLIPMLPSLVSEEVSAVVSRSILHYGASLMQACGMKEERVSDLMTLAIRSLNELDDLVQKVIEHPTPQRH